MQGCVASHHAHNLPQSHACGRTLPMNATARQTRLQAHLVRVECAADHTLGELHVLGEIFWVLELPWRHNQPNVSCIPTGTYVATFLPRSASGKYRRVYWIRNVPGRVGCLQHNGNLTRHSRGCQLIGKRAGRLSGERAVLNSKSALHEYVELLGGAPINLTIVEDAK